MKRFTGSIPVISSLQKIDFEGFLPLGSIFFEIFQGVFILDNLDLIFDKAKTAYEHGNLNKAIELFDQILETDDGNKEAQAAKKRSLELLEEPNVKILRLKRFPGCGSRISFYIDGKLKHKFKNGEFLSFRLPVGRYTFNFDREERCTYLVEIKNDYHILEINCYNSMTGVQMETNERYMVHWYKDIF